MKQTLRKLIKQCEKLGEEKVLDIMEECYCNGSQGSEILWDTERKCREYGIQHANDIEL